MRTNSRLLLLAAAGCGLSALAAAPAAARTCPPGQFLQVSKGKCISKESANKLGISKHAAVSRKAKPEAAQVEKAGAENAGESTVARTTPDKDAADKPKPEVAERAPGKGSDETTVASATSASPGLGYTQTAEEPTVRRNIAPFGALQFGGFK